MAKTVEDCALLLEVHIKGCCIRGNLNVTGIYIFKTLFQAIAGFDNGLDPRQHPGITSNNYVELVTYHFNKILSKYSKYNNT